MFVIFHNHINHSELNDLYAGESFMLAPRYAGVLNTIFTTFVFFSGMPILIPAAMLSLLLTFWCDRVSRTSFRTSISISISISPHDHSVTFRFHGAESFFFFCN